MKIIKLVILWSILLVLIASCSSTRKLPFANYSLEPVTQAMLVDKMIANDNAHKYTQISRFFATYSGEQETTSFKGFARIAQDSLLMLSLSPTIGGEAFRLLLSPDSSKSLDRIEKVYRSSSYELAQQMIPLPYDLVEAVFAYRFSPLVGRNFQLSIADGMYHLEDKKQKTSYTSLKVDGRFLVRKLHYKDFVYNTNVQVSYNSYLELDGQLFPQEVEIHVQKGSDVAMLRITIKKVDHKTSLSFPFHVSSKYIQVKD